MSDSSEHGHLSIVQYLIGKGADIEAQTHKQATPLHYTCSNGYL